MSTAEGAGLPNLAEAETTQVVASLRRLGSAPVRIDWFGNVSKSRRLGSSASTARLCCSRWGATSRGEIEVDVPVAFLRLFRIGDVWQSGRRVGHDPSVERVDFRGLAIDDSSCAVGPAGLPSESGSGSSGYDLPFSQFSAHRNHTGAFVVRVSIDPHTVLLVPCMEIVRFYFGASGGLLSGVFSGAFAERNLTTRARIEPGSGEAFLALGPDLSGVAAPAVARVAFNPIARREFRSLVNSGTAASARDEKYYPRMAFPFVGLTNLLADGEWLTVGQRRVFVVWRLLRCTHPFPFRSLKYTLAKQTRISTSTKAKVEGGGSAAEGDEALVLEEGYSSRSRSAIAVRGKDDPISVQFPDLLFKPVRKLKDGSFVPPQADGNPTEKDAVLSSEHGGGGERQSADVQAPKVPLAVPSGDVLLGLLRESVIGTLCGQVLVIGPAEVRLSHEAADATERPIWYLAIRYLARTNGETVLVMAHADLQASDAKIGLVKIQGSSEGVSPDGSVAAAAESFLNTKHSTGDAARAKWAYISPATVTLHHTPRRCPLRKMTAELL